MQDARHSGCPGVQEVDKLWGQFSRDRRESKERKQLSWVGGFDTVCGGHSKEYCPSLDWKYRDRKGFPEGAMS